MTLSWCSQGDFTDWAVTRSNTSGIRTLQGGNRLVAGTQFVNYLNLVWSDTTLFTFQFTTSEIIYNSRPAGTNCGLIGPKAFAITGDKAFWMSDIGFHVYSGSVQGVPNQDNILTTVLDNMRQDGYQAMTFCHVVPQFNEVWWFYVGLGNTEPSHYVGVCLDTFEWFTGTMERTAACQRPSSQRHPYMATTGGYIMEHEKGTTGDGSAITSSIQTAPMSMRKGELLYDVQGFFPDFKRLSGTCTLTVTMHNELELDPEETLTETLTATDPVADFRTSGRYLAFRMDIKGGDYRLGVPRVEIRTMGNRRGGR